MQVSTANNVKVYNLSAGKSLPEWISDRKKRSLLKNDVALRRRIELIQDFTMPVASTRIQTSSDGQYILAAGVYKPRIRCFDVTQLSMKFERCLDADVINLNILSEDYSKFVLLLANRNVEFHARYGFYYRTRIPRFGRDLAYHYPSCDLYITSDSSDIYRLNLEQGMFLTPLKSKSSGCNVCLFNSEHQLFTAGTEEGTVECWDPRSGSCVGEMTLPVGAQGETEHSDGSLPAVTSLCYKDALTLAVGTASGQILLYDLRSSQPRLVKDHYYGFPIHSIAFQKGEGLVLSADSKILKIWNENDGSAVTSIEPEHPLNDLCHLPKSGLVVMATEDSKMLSYYIPTLGPAPKWCSFLDNLTEELEENPEPTVYEDYKFVTAKDLDSLGLSHLVGSNLLRAYMHGYFMDMKLYHKAKSVVQPFAYEEYRKKRIQKRLEEARSGRIERKKLPKVNKLLAEKFIYDADKAKTTPTKLDVTNPIGDDRFSALFSNPDFEVDAESEEFQLLHPILAHREKVKNKKKIVLERDTGEEELEGRPSDDETSSDESDQEMWREVRRERKQAASSGSKVDFMDASVPTKKTLGLIPLSAAASLAPPKRSKVSLGQRLKEENVTQSANHKQGSILGSREVTVTLQKTDEDDEQRQKQLREHRAERKKVRRSASSILPRTDKRHVYWKGRRVK